MEKIDKNHVVKTYDLFVSFILFSTVGVLIGSILLNNIGNQDIKRAQLDTESLSAQILMGGLKNLPENENSSGIRAPSSVPGLKSKFHSTIGLEGSIGRDPWNKKYHYKLLKKPDGEYSHIIVWSDGPNLQDESSLSTADTNSPQPDHSQVFIRGDDIGYIRTIK